MVQYRQGSAIFAYRTHQAKVKEQAALAALFFMKNVNEEKKTRHSRAFFIWVKIHRVLPRNA